MQSYPLQYNKKYAKILIWIVFCELHKIVLNHRYQNMKNKFSRTMKFLIIALIYCLSICSLLSQPCNTRVFYLSHVAVTRIEDLAPGECPLNEKGTICWSTGTSRALPLLHSVAARYKLHLPWHLTHISWCQDMNLFSTILVNKIINVTEWLSVL